VVVIQRNARSRESRWHLPVIVPAVPIWVIPAAVHVIDGMPIVISIGIIVIIIIIDWNPRRDPDCRHAADGA
jgi:hypothetical protein